MADFNPDEFLGQTAAPQPASQPAGQMGAQAQAFDPDAFLNAQPSVDDNTGEEIPEAFAGRTPDTAMNKSPLSPLDRFKLSMGNQAGNIEYLKKRFDAVEQIPGPDGKPTNELAVMQDGKWHRVDPDNGYNSMDPWEMAKKFATTTYQKGVGAAATQFKDDVTEMASDIADAAPMLAGTAIGTVAAPLTVPAAATAAGVAGAVAAGGAIGGGIAAARTSLGRVVGTYDATPEEQLWDISFETLLNAAGTGVSLGVKPTASFIANKLEDLAAAFPKAAKGVEAIASTPKAAFKKMFSALSVGEDNFDTMIEHTYKTKALMQAADQKAGGNVAAYHDVIAGRQIDDIKDIAQNSRTTLTKIYGKMKDKILADVPENFTANFDDAINSSYSSAINKGLGKIIIPTQTVVKGERDYITGKVAENIVEGSRTLVGAEAAEYMAKNGLKGGAKFQLLSQEEMANAVHAGKDLKDEMAYLASDSDVYNVVKGYYDEMGTFAGAAKRQGRQAADNLLTFKKLAADKAQALANMEKVRDVPAVRMLMNQSRAAVDNSIHNSLKSAGVAGQFVEMNGTYSQLAESFSPLLNANYRYEKTGDPKVYETLLNQFLSKPGKQVSNRFAVDAAIQAAEDNGLGGLAKSLANGKTRIQIGEAAKAFNPLPSENKRRMMQIGLTGIAGAAASGNPLVAGAIGAGMALRSPMTAKAGVALTQAAFKGQQMLAGLKPDLQKQFLNNPRAVQAFTQAIIQAPQVRNQVSNQLNQQMGISQGQ